MTGRAVRGRTSIAMRFAPRHAAALLAAVLLLARGAVPALAEAAVAELRVATWNVENLFDAVVNQPKSFLTGEPADAEWCAQSWRRWTEERYQTKLTRLAWAIDRMRPDVLVVAEVENRAVVEALAARLKSNHGWTFDHIAHRDSRDPRGIDVAVLSRYPIRRVDYKGRIGRRGLLVAEIEVDGTRVAVLANHWKSQVGDAKTNIAARTVEAADARAEIVRRLARDPDAVVVCCGDYNEDMDGPAITDGLRPANDRATALASARGPAEEVRPYNLVADIPEKERGSFYYARRKMWNTFDGIHIAPRMLLPPAEPGPAWRAGKPSATITFHPPEMRWGKDGRPKSFRRVRSYEAGTDGDTVSDESYYGDGYSDHFPVLTVLRRAPSSAGGGDAE